MATQADRTQTAAGALLFLSSFFFAIEGEVEFLRPFGLFPAGAEGDLRGLPEPDLLGLRAPPRVVDRGVDSRQGAGRGLARRTWKESAHQHEGWTSAPWNCFG